MLHANQNPEQFARDEIDRQLVACGWVVQSVKEINLQAGVGVAVREYSTDVGPADYVLFATKELVDIKFKRIDSKHAIKTASKNFNFSILFVITARFLSKI